VRQQEKNLFENRELILLISPNTVVHSTFSWIVKTFLI